MRPAFWVMIALSIIGVSALPGCSAGVPVASISDPQVYTLDEIVLAEKQLANSSGPSATSSCFISDAISRNFLQVGSPNNSQLLPADRMLMGVQRSSALLSQVQSLSKLRISAQLAANGNSDQVASDTVAPTMPFVLPGASTTAQPADEIPTAPPPGDSPFDRLNRVSDFYIALLIKHLQASHTPWSTKTQQPVGPTSYSTFASDRFHDAASDHVKLMMCMQTHLDPGTRQSYSAGVLVQVLAVLDDDAKPIIVRPLHAEANQAKADADTLKGVATLERLSRQSVQILHVHPTSTYDLDETNYAQTLETAMRLSADITAPNVGANAQKDTQTRSRLAREFLSRVAKQASYVSANEKIFGWNFYPSNLQIRKRGLFQLAMSSLVGDSESYDVDSTLEGGARDCAVFISVPTNARYLKLAIGYRYATLSGSQVFQPQFIGDLLTGRFRLADRGQSDLVPDRAIFVTLPRQDSTR